MKKTTEERLDHHRKFCQHYDASGITMIGGKEPHGHCKAGIVYLQQFGEAPNDGNHMLNGRHYPSSGIFQRICCTSGGKLDESVLLARCPKWERTTIEQAQGRVDDMDRAVALHMKVMPVVAEWRKKQPMGKQEVIDCPACNGRLHLSQSSYNGHVHGRCETKGCVSWME